MKDFIYGIIAKPLFWLYSGTGNYALSLILFLILVRVVFIVFDYSKTNALIKTRLSKPFVNKIKEKCLGKDSKKFENATMEVFELTKTSQFSNIIPMIIEYPLILAIFYSLYHPISVLFPMLKDSIPKMKNIATYMTGGMFDEINIINAIKKSPEDFKAIGDISGIQNLNTKLFEKIDLLSSASFDSWNVVFPILLILYFAFLIFRKILPVLQKKKKLSEMYLSIGLYVFVGISFAISAFSFPILFYAYFIIFSAVGILSNYLMQKFLCKKKLAWVKETNVKCQEVLKKYEIEDYVSALREDVEKHEKEVKENGGVMNESRT